ncbi:MAG: LysE family transporter, partial [Pseudomonadota bacterium]
MIDAPAFLLFLVGALALNLTPGPDMAFTLATSVKAGARGGVAAALGIGAGSLAWASLTAFGLAAILALSQHGLTFLRLAGAAFLLYLA